jgi:Zn-finger protein
LELRFYSKIFLIKSSLQNKYSPLHMEAEGTNPCPCPKFFCLCTIQERTEQYIQDFTNRHVSYADL